MSFEINETSSSILQRSLAASTKNLQASMLKLSYGQKQSSIEDAANLIISEEMEAQRRGSMQAVENAQTGMNMLSTAESGLSTINDNLQKIRELSIQRANDTYSDEDKAAMDQEISALTAEIDRTAKTTSFNKQALLDGSSSDVNLQIGANSDKETNTINFKGAFDGGVSSSDLNIGSPDDPDFLKNIDNALNDVNSRRSDIGATYNRLDGIVNSLYVQNENITAAQSRIRDVDVATEVSKLTQNQILQSSSATLLAQANQSASIASILL